MRITIACPEAMLNDANALAAALAFGLADLLTFVGLNWQDGTGNLYAAASLDASPEFIAGAQTALARPDWDTGTDVNLTGASRAQAKLVLWTGEGSIPQASPAALTVIAGMSGVDALAAMGLTQVQNETL